MRPNVTLPQTTNKPDTANDSTVRSRGFKINLRSAYRVKGA